MNAPVTPIRTEAENALVAAFGAARPGLAGGEAVAQRRDEALAAFMRSGLPHRRVEAWHYTDLRAALREVLVLQFLATKIGSRDGGPRSSLRKRLVRWS